MNPPNSKTYRNHPANPAHSPEQISFISLLQNHPNMTAIYSHFINEKFHYCRFYSNSGERNSGVSAGLEGFNYRYHFNNKESDNEVIGEGNSYDFGARMYDSRLGRWWSVDPLANIFPFESYYCFVSNNPIIALDLDGKQKIVIAGSANMSAKEPLTFIYASKAQLLIYVDQVKKAKTNEKVSWLIFDYNYTDDQKSEFAKWAKANGVQEPIYVSSSQEVINYLNSKNKNESAVTKSRTKDLISGFTVFAHGAPGVILFGFDNFAHDRENCDFGKDQVNQLGTNIFKKGIEVIKLWSCNSATPEGLAKDYMILRLRIPS